MPDLTGRRILVVDDIATNRLVAAAMLQALRAVVVEADGGAEALRVVAETRVELVLPTYRCRGWTDLRSEANCGMARVAGRRLKPTRCGADRHDPSLGGRQADPF